MDLAGRPVETDLSPASWVVSACEGQQWGTVASLLPPVFDAYARVFHPAIRYEGDDDVDVGWTDVAAENGTTAHPLMEWGSITGSMDYFTEDNQSPLWDDAPAMGHLPEHVAERLAAVLRRHTTTPDDCWFGLSDTWAQGPTDRRLTVGGRGFWLLRGPVELAAANLLPEPSSQSANLWWPADRVWCVATDIDLVTTYVGGSPDCIADLLAADGLETAPAHAGQAVTWDSDRVNPPPADSPSAGGDR